MEQNLFKYIWKFSRLQQIITLSLILVSFPFLYYSIDLPKIIINEAIDVTGVAENFKLLGYDFTQLQYLFILCSIFALLVFINGAFKYQINIYKGVMAERLLRRLRFMLIERALRFPLPQFQRTSSGEIVTMVTAEVEPLGGFFGDAFALLAFQGGTFITIIAFMFIQDPWLGLAAFISIPIQGYIIPKLQKRINQLGKERVRHVRGLSNRINEVIIGIEDIHAQDHAKYVLADISKRLGSIFWIRFDIYKHKFFMKFLNNLIGQLTPFFFYSIGGYLVLQGDLSIGALVAALAAYKDLAAPWKELLNYYQRMADARIKYEQLHNQFVPAGMLEKHLLHDEPNHLPYLADQPLEARNLTWMDEDGIKPVETASIKLAPASYTLLTSTSGTSRDTITRLLARLVRPTGGKINIGDIDLSQQHEALTGRRIGVLSANPGFLNADIATNLFMGLMHKTPEEAETDETRKAWILEAKASGNIPYNVDLDWLDYPLAGTDGYESLRRRTEQLLEKCELDQDFYELGLRLPANAGENPGLVERVLSARQRVRQYLNDSGMEDFVKSYHMSEYNDYSSVAENILFGKPACETFDLANLPRNPIILSLLKEFDLEQRFVETGVKCAALMVDLFKDLPAGHVFFEQYSFVKEERLDDLKHMVGKIEQNGLDNIDADEKDFLLGIPFQLTPQRHRLGLINDEIRHRLVQMRHKLHQDHPEIFKTKIQAFDMNRFNSGLSIQENILFGRIAYGRADAWKKVMKAIDTITRELNMRSGIMRAAFSYHAGIGGSRLSIAQRQKIALVRNLVKRPDILIINDGLNMVEAKTQGKIIRGLKEIAPKLTLLWVSNAIPETIHFDQHLEIRAGKIMELGAEEPQAYINEIATPEPQGEDMAMETEIRALQTIPLFVNLDVSRLKLLAFTSEHKTYAEGEILFRQNDNGEAAYVILSGKADIVLETRDGRENILFQVGKNQLVGELALLCDTPRSATVRALTPLTALKLNKEIFTELARQDAHFSFEMTRDMSGRLVKTTSELNTITDSGK